MFFPPNNASACSLFAVRGEHVPKTTQVTINSAHHWHGNLIAIRVNSGSNYPYAQYIGKMDFDT